MSTQDPIEELRTSVNKSLSEIVSLKKTSKDQETKITDMTDKNNELTKELKNARTELEDLTKEFNQLKKKSESKGSPATE
ncbi:MAG: hypothetical protein IH946_06370 [Bacteroidetes bacterium]|nr:hypothetical protein [Bacteroidota bacterium]